MVYEDDRNVHQERGQSNDSKGPKQHRKQDAGDLQDHIRRGRRHCIGGCEDWCPQSIVNPNAWGYRLEEE